jgi:hypothetical protein
VFGYPIVSHIITQHLGCGLCGSRYQTWAYLDSFTQLLWFWDSLFYEEHSKSQPMVAMDTISSECMWEIKPEIDRWKGNEPYVDDTVCEQMSRWRYWNQSVKWRTFEVIARGVCLGELKPYAHDQWVSWSRWWVEWFVKSLGEVEWFTSPVSFRQLKKFSGQMFQLKRSRAHYLISRMHGASMHC